jgi:hypothetical protein
MCQRGSNRRGRFKVSEALVARALPLPRTAKQSAREVPLRIHREIDCWRRVRARRRLASSNRRWRPSTRAPTSIGSRSSSDIYCRERRFLMMLDIRIERYARTDVALYCVLWIWVSQLVADEHGTHWPAQRNAQRRRLLHFARARRRTSVFEHRADESERSPARSPLEEKTSQQDDNVTMRDSTNSTDDANETNE